MKTIQRLALAVIALASLAYGQGSNGNNFGGGGGSGVTITNVAGLASVAGKTKGTIAVVTDGNSATDCTTGGASTVVVCQYSGSTWSQMVAASSGSTAFSALSGSTNSTAAMVIGTGASLNVSGSGANNATGNVISGQTGLLSFTGITSTNRIKTVRDAADTLLELGGSYTPTGTWTSMTLAGGALSGTFTGTPTFSGNVAFSGTPTFSNTLALNTSGNAGTSTTAANLTGCTGTATGDICYYNSGWTRLAGNASGTKFLQETSAGAISWATGGSAPSLDQVTGSAAQATGTETAAGHQYTFAGVETSNLDAPFSFTNANSTNNNTSIGLLAGVTGTSTGGIAALFYDVSGTGDLADFYSGGSVSNGTYTVGTKEASIGATGNLALAGSLTTNSATNVCGSSSPCIGGVEGATGPTPTATDDFFFMSSANHCIEGSYNNGALACVPLVNLPETWTGAHIFSVAGAASTPALSITGAPYTGGSTTTNFPQFYMNDGTGPTTFSAAGTEMGINAPSGFTGNLADYHINGGPSVFAVNYQGAIVMGNATSGLLTIQPATGAITSYTIDLPVAQPSGSNTFLSCTAANPAVCTWVSGFVHTLNFQFGTPGGSAISTGILGYATVPIGCTITGWDIAVDAGTATVKTLKVAAGTAIPTLGSNSISTSGVAISTGTVVQSTTLTDFTTTTVTANDIVGADLITTSGVGYINFQLVMSCTK